VINSALEIAAVGLTEEQADDAGFESDVARASLVVRVNREHIMI